MLLILFDKILVTRKISYRVWRADADKLLKYNNLADSLRKATCEERDWRSY